MPKSTAKKTNQNVAMLNESETTQKNVGAPVVIETAAPTETKASEPVPAKAAAPVAEKAAKAKAAAKESKEKKVAAKKPKLVRDSFTFPETDYAQIAALKQRALNAGREIKKTEVLRAGLALLSGLSDGDLLSALDGIDKLKPGRPAK